MAINLAKVSTVATQASDATLAARFPAVTAWGKSADKADKGLVPVTVELVTAIAALPPLDIATVDRFVTSPRDVADVPTVASANAIMADAKRAFGYDSKGDVGKAAWRQMARRALRIGLGWLHFAPAYEAASGRNAAADFADGTISIREVFDAIGSDASKAKSEANAAEKAATREAEDRELLARHGIVDGMGPTTVITIAEQARNVALALDEGRVGEGDASALANLFDAIDAYREAIAEKARQAA